MAGVGFHEGELSVQRRAGVEREAARLEGMLDPPRLDGGAGRFLAQRELALLTGHDEDGHLWISPLTGSAGFLEARGTTLTVHTAPGADDPLHGLLPGRPVGLLAIDLAIRRRVRVNGTLAAAGEHSLEITVDQAFGNCPSYIQRRHVERVPAPTSSAAVRWGSTLDDDQIKLVERADTFFLGTEHPVRGADASHRGGPPGFVRVEGTGLWWPDYAGNNMFNSLGNLAVNPAAALLFTDFTSGVTLRLSGTAALEWIAPSTPGDDGGTGRRVRFHPVRTLVAGTPLLTSSEVGPSPYNPTVRD
jgi:predicted pyridoxine 5'-phosphate oxidase superfamily flavin-nucleotide-binding protein